MLHLILERFLSYTYKPPTTDVNKSHQKYLQSCPNRSKIWALHTIFTATHPNPSHLFLKFIYFNWRLITLQYRSGCATRWHESAMGVHVFPILNPPHLPPHPIPLGHPRAPALSTLSHAPNLDGRYVSHMIIYMFQCYSLTSSHPRLLPQNPKDCSIHLCLFYCLSCRVIITIFLNSIYMC